MANAIRSIAPSPEVQYLPAIFRRIQAGDIRMPAFQRGFAWNRAQVLDLLSSIYQGFPIGSVLLWRTNNRELNLEDPSKSFFPKVLPEKFPTTYILDGLQRISALYVVFHFDPAEHPEKFQVAFDLKTKEFGNVDPNDPTRLPLNVLFRPTEFIQYHGKLASHHDGTKLINGAVELLTTFQEYLIPIVTIEERTADDVVQIFERINSTGTKLGAVDFMRAVTWSGEFDLNKGLDAIHHVAEEAGFDIPPETLVKVLAIALDYSPAPDAMLKMKALSAAKLHEGIGTAIEIVKRTTQFLLENLQIPNYDLIPYEGQFLGLVGFCKAPGIAKQRSIDEVVRWFWAASLNEEMQGRSDHQKSQIVQFIEMMREGTIANVQTRLTLTTNTLKNRRFRWGTALSSALASMLAKNSARSLISGEKIPTDEYLLGEAGKNFVGLAGEFEVASVIDAFVPQGKVIANTIVLSDVDMHEVKKLDWASLFQRLRERHSKEYAEILNSQFISKQAAEHLISGQIADFLELRACSVLEFSKKLAVPNAQ